MLDHIPIYSSNLTLKKFSIWESPHHLWQQHLWANPITYLKSPKSLFWAWPSQAAPQIILGIFRGLWGWWYYRGSQIISVFLGCFCGLHPEIDFPVLTGESSYHKRPLTGIGYFHSGACFSKKLTAANTNSTGWEQGLLTSKAALDAYKPLLKGALDNPWLQGQNITSYSSFPSAHISAVGPLFGYFSCRSTPVCEFSLLRYRGLKDIGGAMQQDKWSLLGRCTHHEGMVHSLPEYLTKIIRMGGERCCFTRRSEPILSEVLRYLNHYTALGGHWGPF